MNIGFIQVSFKRGNSVLDRVGQQQSKWQRNVQQQRRNIYDRRTMLKWRWGSCWSWKN